MIWSDPSSQYKYYEKNGERLTSIISSNRHHLNNLLPNDRSILLVERLSSLSHGNEDLPPRSDLDIIRRRYSRPAPLPLYFLRTEYYSLAMRRRSLLLNRSNTE